MPEADSPKIELRKLDRATDDELMSRRLCDLPVKLESTLLTDCLSRLFEELSGRSLRFRPHVWLSDEWFCPDGVPGFAIPFYLAHPRLVRLERDEMKAVEGGTRRDCLRLLRHETGHAIDNAFRLRRLRKRQQLFGPSGTEYPESYAPRPFSRKFVRYLEGAYAQAHPDEDFAETFASWLDPGSRWRARYRNWPKAMEKLSFLDGLMASLAGRAPVVRNRKRPSSLSRLRQTLEEHYREKKDRLRVDFASNYDADLERIFGSGTRKGGVTAAEFLASHRGFLRRRVAKWTGMHAYVVDAVLGDWIARCRERQIRFPESKRAESKYQLLTALTVRAMEYRESGHYRIPL